MNKKLLLVLLISALMLFCFAWVYARHADETKGTTTSERPSDEVLKELKELGKRIKPETEAVPEVKLEDMPPLPHVGEVRRPSEQEYQRMLQTKGLVPTDPVKMMDNLKGSAVPVPAGVVDDRALTECLVYVHDPATCCYYHPDGEEGLWGWGVVQMKTWNDPQAAPEQSACGYPIYPFAVKGVEVQIFTIGPSKIFASFDIEDFVWDHCSPYPGDVLYESEIIEFDLPGGWAFIGVEFEDSICVYDRFFASWTFYNDMDFYPFGEEPPCWGDPVDYADTCIISIDTTWVCELPAPPPGDSCPYEIIGDDTTWGHWEVDVIDTTLGHIAPFDFMPSLVFDLSGWCERTYWSFAYYWTIGVFWDAVCDLPAFGFGWPGACRIRAWGATAHQNDCPELEYWWQKEAFEFYAPSGMPDFDQKDKEEFHGWTIVPFDGPTAAANCFWWMASAEMLEPFWAVQPGCPNPADPWDPVNVPFLINEFATYMGLGDCGVTPAGLDSGLEALKTEKVLWFTHEEIQPPTWEDIEYNCRISQDVLLLLGFWYEDPVGSGTWYRIGGHWVTVAGVEHMAGLLKISDPDLDAFELGLAPGFIGNGTYIPHTPPHVGDFTQHNDAGNVSHDVYQVAPSPSPGGVIALVEYPYWDLGIGGPEMGLEKYLGHNLKPEFEQNQAPAVPEPGTQIFVEVECAKVICPEEPFKCATIWSVDGLGVWTGMTKSNYGREACRDENGFWWDPWSNVYAISALFDGSIILGTDQSNFAFFGGDNDPPGEFWPYIPLDYAWYAGPEEVSVPGYVDSSEALYLNNLYTKYLHNYPRDAGLPLDVDQTAISFDDPYYTASNLVFQIFVITNTGVDPIADLKFALWNDWDLQPDGYLDMAGADSSLSLGWIYNTAGDDTPFGTMILPVNGIVGERFIGLDNPTYVHPHSGWGHDRDTLQNLMYGAGHAKYETGLGPDDMSSFHTTNAFTLAAGESQTIVTITGDAAPAPMGGFLCDALRFAGFYRGDANIDGMLNLGDVLYLANYLLKSGPAPMPFKDQGDVNRDGAVDVMDVIYLANYKFGTGSAPTDYARFPVEIPFPDQVSMFEVAGFKDLCK